MSASFHKQTKSLDPLGHAAVEGVFGIEKSDKEAKAAEAAAKKYASDQDAMNAAAADRLTTRQVATRGQELRSAASAAGATQSGNKADWLAGPKTRKRRDASVALLGS
jgi:cytochrome c5